MARIAVAPPLNTIKTTSEALAVKFETFTIAAVAATPVFGWHLQRFLRILRCIVAGVKIRSVPYTTIISSERILTVHERVSMIHQLVPTLRLFLLAFHDVGL